MPSARSIGRAWPTPCGCGYGAGAVQRLARDGHTLDFVKDQYRHCKTILALGASKALLDQAGIPHSGEPDPGLAFAEASGVAKAAKWFIGAVALHRHTSRDRDPPPV